MMMTTIDYEGDDVGAVECYNDCDNYHDDHDIDIDDVNIDTLMVMM